MGIKQPEAQLAGTCPHVSQVGLAAMARMLLGLAQVPTTPPPASPAPPAGTPILSFPWGVGDPSQCFHVSTSFLCAEING